MKQRLKLAGAIACLFALLLNAGGYWAALQSVAWARMLAGFSQRDSLAEALSKTFDGKHPCKLCLQIRAERQQQQREQSNWPSLRTDREPDVFCNFGRTILVLAPAEGWDAVAFVPGLKADRTDSPPTPPPRV